jgi:hypothetical protein
MPHLIPVPSRLAGLALCKRPKGKAIVFPTDARTLPSIPLQQKKQRANQNSSPSSFKNSHQILLNSLKFIFLLPIIRGGIHKKN